MTMPAELTTAHSEAVLDEIERVVVGKRAALTLILTAVLAGGHVLIEDLPGLGKTLIAKSFARALGLSFTRVQFTPDLLPADLLGSTIYDMQSGRFEFRRGPIFTNLLLGDEINRTPPKTQAALLEVMEEGQVSVEGTPRPLPRPFLVAATQNPIEYEGTYPLPEAQLDRFLIKTSLGYPARAAMIEVLAGAAAPDRSRRLHPVLSTGDIGVLAGLAAQTHTDRAVLDYVAGLAEATRTDATVQLGVSTRGALGMVRCAQVWAVAQGRHFVLPDDVKALAGPVWEHRIVVDPDASFSGATAAAVIARALNTVAAPASGI